MYMNMYVIHGISIMYSICNHPSIIYMIHHDTYVHTYDTLVIIISIGPRNRWTLEASQPGRRGADPLGPGGQTPAFFESAARSPVDRFSSGTG